MSWLERRTNFLTVILLAFVLLHITVVFPRLINPDASIFLDLGYRLLDGERLYVDYEENHSPTIHYLSAVPSAIGRALAIPASTPFSLMLFIGVSATCFLAGAWIRRKIPDGQSLGTIVQLSLAVCAVWFYLRFEWGQREHLFLLFYMPWFIVRVARYQGGTFAPLTLLTVGLAAGIGVSIKPHFVLVAALPEIFLLLTTRRFRLLFTLEVLGVGLIATANGLYFALQPEVWVAYQVLLSRLVAGYGAYGDVPPLDILRVRGLTLLIASAPLVGWAVWPRLRRTLPPFILAAACASLGGVMILAIQRKGWSNHELPALWMNTIIIGWLLWRGLDALTPSAKRFLVLSVVSLATLFAAYYYGNALGILRARDAYAYRLAGYVERYTAVGDEVLFADPIIFAGYPMLVVMNRHNASRYPIAGPIPMAYYAYDDVAYTDPNHVVPEYAQDYLDNFAADLALHTPKLVIIRSSRCEIGCDIIPDLYTYLLARGVIDAAVLPNYDLVAIDQGFHIYQRKRLSVP